MAWLRNILLVICGSCTVFADSVLPPKCAASSCLAPTCPRPFTPPGECCPVCPKVSASTCTLERCIVPVDCKDTYIPEGQCCPVCRGGKRCVYKGTVYKDGQSFKDDCNTCTCISGNVGCTKIGCITDTVKPGKCPRPTGPGTCAEECFADSSCPLNQKCCSNGCGHTCQTPVGATDCTLVDCMPITCADQYTPPLECCPVCRTSGNYRPVKRV